MTSTEEDNLSIDPARNFDRFLRLTEPRLRLALTSTYSFEEGREATAEALAWAWEHRDRLGEIKCPVRYLYRVGQSHVRRRKLRMPFARAVWAEPRIEPELMGALRKLSERQRVAVVLVHGCAWPLAEVVELLELKVPTVQTHLERGLSRLRSLLEVTEPAETIITMPPVVIEVEQTDERRGQRLPVWGSSPEQMCSDSVILARCRERSLMQPMLSGAG